MAVEAFHVTLAVTGEGTREVPGVFNMPQGSATGWGDIFDRLKDRGLRRIGLMVADGKGILIVAVHLYIGFLITMTSP